MDKIDQRNINREPVKNKAEAGSGAGERGIFSGDVVRSRRTLYTAGAFAKEHLLYLQEAGELAAVRQHISRRQRLASYLFFIVLEGAGRLEYEGRNYALRQNSCVFIDCRKRYCHEPDPKALWRLKWVHFDGGSMSAIYRRYMEVGGAPVFMPGDPNQYEQIIDGVIDAAERAGGSGEMEIFSLLSALLYRLSLQQEPSPSPSAENEEGRIASVRAYLDENYAKSVTLDQLEGRFHVNKYYLTRIFKQETGMSVMTYKSRRQITEAKRLLRFTSLTVAQVGRQCGFEDAGYFGRVFRDTEKMSPGEFRRLWTVQ